MKKEEGRRKKEEGVCGWAWAWTWVGARISAFGFRLFRCSALALAGSPPPFQFPQRVSSVHPFRSFRHARLNHVRLTQPLQLKPTPLTPHTPRTPHIQQQTPHKPKMRARNASTHPRTHAPTTRQDRPPAVSSPLLGRARKIRKRTARYPALATSPLPLHHQIISSHSIWLVYPTHDPLTPHSL